MDKIIIRDLRVCPVIGTLPHEREAGQDVILNVEIYTDLSAAGRSDELMDTIDYKALKKQIVEMAENSSFLLIERLAQAVADVCLDRDGVEKVKICLDKPGALSRARSVAVEIERSKKLRQ